MNIFIQKFPKNGLMDLAIETKLDEALDYDCQWIVARGSGGKIIGVVGFNLEKEKYPRFESILISPEHQKTSLGVKLMMKMEDYIFNYLEQGCYLSYILDDNQKMKSYAHKWGMKSFQKDDTGEWFFKPNPWKGK